MFDVSLADIENIKTKKHRTLMITGCVDYLFPTGDKHHQSRFVYEVDRLAPTGAVLQLEPAAGNVPINEIGLMANPDIAGDAD
jgi:hypothetical protein